MDISFNLDKFIRTISDGNFKIHIPILLQNQLLISDSHFHHHPEMFLQCSGSCLFTFPSEEIILNEGEILIIPPFFPHKETVLNTDNEFKNIVIFENQRGFGIHIGVLGENSRPIINDAIIIDTNHMGYSKHLDKILNETRITDGLNNIITNNRLLVIIYDVLLALKKPVEPLYNNDKVVKCTNLIQAQISDPYLSVAALADQLQINPDYLSNIFSSNVGLTIISFINGQRINLAKYLLVGSQLNSSEVAWACGYRNPGYFNRIFKEACGVSPLNFRKKQTIKN
ncbi:MAG: AraC family transcriptional regulator [Spirochaetaceae bacterium]